MAVQTPFGLERHDLIDFVHRHQGACKGSGQNDVKMHAKAEASVFQKPTVILD